MSATPIAWLPLVLPLVMWVPVSSCLMLGTHLACQEQEAGWSIAISLAEQACVDAQSGMLSDRQCFASSVRLSMIRFSNHENRVWTWTWPEVWGAVCQSIGPEPHSEVCVQRLMESGPKVRNLKPSCELCDASTISDATLACHITIHWSPSVILPPSTPPPMSTVAMLPSSILILTLWYHLGKPHHI